MIEKIVLDFLNTRLGVPAYMEMPEAYAPPLALVQKTGGGGENHIFHAMFAVQSYGKTLYEAAVWNERVKETMKRLIELDEISSVSLNSDYNYTNDDTKRYRYQAVFDIVHY